MKNSNFPPTPWGSRLFTLFTDVALIAALYLIAFHDGPNTAKATLAVQLLVWPTVILSMLAGTTYALLDRKILIDMMKIRAVKDILEKKNNPQILKRFELETAFLEQEVPWKLWPDKLIKRRAKSMPDIHYNTTTDVIIITLLFFCGLYWLALFYVFAAVAVMKMTSQACELYLYRYAIVNDKDIEVKYEH